MVTTGVTRPLITTTTRLRATLRSVDPLTLIAGVALLLVALIAARGQATPAQPIIVIATPTLGLPPANGAARLNAESAQRMLATARPRAQLLPTAQSVPQGELAPVPPAQPEPTAEPQSAPIVSVQSAEQPEPTPAATTEAHWEGETFVINGSTIPTVAPAMQGQPGANGWVCGAKYGDWRDTDPMYTHPECYDR